MKRRSISARLSVLAAAIALASPLFPVAAHAANSQSLTLSPSSTAITLEKATPAARNVTLINDGDSPYTISLSVSPFRVEGDNYNQQFTRLPGTTDPSVWVELSQKTVSLPAHKTIDVPYTVTAPAATAAGGYYAVIFAEVSGDAGTGGVSTKSRVGDILYMTVSGQVKQEGSLTPDNLPGFVFGSTVPIGLKVTNNGGVHFISDASLRVTSLFGKEVFNATASPYVLPQTTRLISQTWSPKSIAGIYKVSRHATVFGSEKSLPDQWVVVVTPKIIPIIVFLALAIVGFLLLLGRTRKHKR